MPHAIAQPLQLSGALDQFESFQVTPCIGTEFVNVDLAQWITGPDSDALLRDLAITGNFHNYQQPMSTVR